jgi:addiction module RelB/DinJ family antitoxin
MSEGTRERKKTSTTIARLEPEIKQQAENIFRELGLSASSAIDLFYRQVIMRRGLPFDVALSPVNMEKNDFRKMDTLLDRGWKDLEMGGVSRLQERDIAGIFADGIIAESKDRVDSGRNLFDRIYFSDIARQELDGIQIEGSGQNKNQHIVIRRIMEITRDKRLCNTVLQLAPWNLRGVRLASAAGYCIFFIRDGESVKILRIIYFGIPSLQRIWDLGDNQRLRDR